jgi:hypothetical protein
VSEAHRPADGASAVHARAGGEAWRRRRRRRRKGEKGNDDGRIREY